MDNIDEKLTGNDIAFILESLKYTRMKFESYKYYPNEKFRKEQIERVDTVMSKVRVLGKYLEQKSK